MLKQQLAMQQFGQPNIISSIKIGEIIESTYKIERLLAVGQQSTIFQARSLRSTDANYFALKLEYINLGQAILQNEVVVLQRIGGREHFAQIYKYGLHKQYKFLAIDLLGPNVSDILRQTQIRKLSLSSVVKIGIQGLEALSTLHKAGFTHGQINSENIVIGYQKEQSGNLYLIDFAQSQQINSRKKSAKTINILQLVQNDLHSLLRMVMSLYLSVNDDQVNNMNGQEAQFNEYDEILHEIVQFDAEISKIDFESIGDYSQLQFLLRMMAESNGANLSNPFEWQFEINQQAINQMEQQKRILKERQNQLSLLVNKFKIPNNQSGPKEDQKKAIQFALQALPQRPDQITLDLILLEV
ncbi:MAG: putative Tau tubulin kinase 1 [Streblomastix strix]|uniref:Putative Tau tubulin kinase 1 n=1 Tax=Streblomastix strix TaxID=222440 RepID=A0A5J4UUM9_9EUKA|nr:MAG: putative Tau tubulin kinase 1 [Streblomastix strix]